MRLLNLAFRLKQYLLDCLCKRPQAPVQEEHQEEYLGPEHPLKVYLPMAGRLFLVQWWTHNEQYHVLLTRSETKALEISRKLFGAHRDSRVKSYLEIELAAPPAKLCEEAAQKVRASDVRDFLRSISFFLFDLEEAGKPLPAVFVKCDDYQVPYEQDREASSPGQRLVGEYAAKEHWDCINCVGSFRLANMSGDEFYDRYYRRWQEAHPCKYHYTGKRINRDPVPKYSRAPIAQDVTELWMATPDFGHHQPGVDLVKLEPGAVYIKPALFYYRIIRELDVSPLQNIIDTLATEKKQQDAARSAALKQEREQEKQREIEQTLTFFN